MHPNMDKNRNRDPFSFANINLLGKCNVNCFFCLGKDIEELLCQHNQLAVPYGEWKNFFRFLKLCREKGVNKLYITGQNTDSLLYEHLHNLIEYLHGWGFLVGLRTNGYLAIKNMGVINECDLSVGYSIHSLSPVTNKMMLGRSDLPDWNTIIPATRNPRISVVLNRCNSHELFDLLRFFKQFENIRYIQIRRVSTDTRIDELAPDIEAYERVYTQVSKLFPIKDRLWTDAEVYDIYGMDVVFWRTVKTSVNSLNYFTDGTVSDEYFVVEGYLKNMEKGRKHEPVKAVS